MKILAIETSCDETAIAIAEFSGLRRKPRIKVLSNIVSSQVKLHAKFGGVVPNLARREHQQSLPILLKLALKESKLLKISNFQFPISKKITKSPPRTDPLPADKLPILNSILEREPELLKKFKKHLLPLHPPAIDLVAVTYGPGLAPALWVGINFAKALAFLWNKPLVPVNHMMGHLFSPLLQPSHINPKSKILNPKQISNPKSKFSKRVLDFENSNLDIISDFGFRILNLCFPALALLVSGGHTELVLMPKKNEFKVIGETLDDAAGESFDKVARMLGLKYPGGPEISRLADKFRIQNSPPKADPPLAEKLKIKLPRPMINSKDYNFSFSGLKTAVLYLLEDLKKKNSLAKLRPAVAFEFQNAAIDVLVSKTMRAAKEFKVKTILLGGGVAANKLLRQRFEKEIKSAIPDAKFLIPDLSLTGDNALMIALAAYFSGHKKAWNKIHAEPNLRLS